MKKIVFVLSFMLFGLAGFSNPVNLETDRESTITSKVYVKKEIKMKVYVKKEIKMIEDRCFVRYCVETENGLSCTEWKEIPCPQQ